MKITTIYNKKENYPLLLFNLFKRLTTKKNGYRPIGFSRNYFKKDRRLLKWVFQ